MRLPGGEMPRLQRVFIQSITPKRVVEGVGMSIDDLVRHFYLTQHNNYATVIFGPALVGSYHLWDLIFPAV